MALTDSREFYTRYVAAATPVVLADAARTATGGAAWDDDFLLRMCRTDGGQPWHSIIEVNKVIVTNTRWPLLDDDWDFCRNSFCEPLRHARSDALT